MRVSGKETLSARNKVETTSKRVFRQEVERLAVCNASHSTWNNGKNKAHIAIYPPAPPPVLGSSGLCTRQASARHSYTPAPALHPRLTLQTSAGLVIFDPLPCFTRIRKVSSSRLICSEFSQQFVSVILLCSSRRDSFQSRILRERKNYYKTPNYLLMR